ncbi:MAG: hypothetical protein CVU06_08710, partial [Bacteroidetes bacterium HGW-Bacteroidetes-22]
MLHNCINKYISLSEIFKINLMKSKKHFISSLQHYLFLAIFVCFAISCSKDDDETNTPVPIPMGDVFAFVDLNHQWIYDVTVSQQGQSKSAVDTFAI